MEWEFAFLDWIQAHLRSGFGDFFFPLITVLGNVGIFWLLCGVALLFFKKYRTNGLMVLVGIAIGALICNVLLKGLVARDRPCWIRPDIALLIATPKDFSFPSGHTTAATVGATLLTYADKRFGYVAIPLAVLIAFSRLYLYVHFPTDILFGALSGAIASVLTIWLFAWIRKKRCKLQK